MANQALHEKHTVRANISFVDLIRVIFQLNQEAQFVLVTLIVENWSDGMLERLSEMIGQMEKDK